MDETPAIFGAPSRGHPRELPADTGAAPACLTGRLMHDDRDDLLRISLTEAVERLASELKPFMVLFRRGEFSVELFAPRGTDTQQPHDQDEAYIVTSGSGMFRRGEERVPFQQGDLLFVAAGIPHRFEEFTDDFRTWVIFFGPKGGQGE